MAYDSWPSKDPDEVLDYSIDWTDRLAGDTISSASWSLVRANGVAIDDDSTSGAITTVWLSGGTIGGSALVQCRIVTTAGRTMDMTYSLGIRSR